MPTLSISSEKVCYLIVKAREFDVQDIASDPESGSNASDDQMIDVLEEHSDNPVVQEISTFIADFSDDEKADIMALMQLGRGDGTFEDWEALRDQAFREHAERTAAYLMGEPLLGDYLEEGLSQFGFSCAEFEMGRL
jgi:Protein of unknown function (DUF3775)